MGGLVGVAGSWSRRLPGPALCGGSQLLVGRLYHEAASCRPLGVPGLMLAHWWVEVGLRISGCWDLEFLELCRTTQGEHLGHDETEREERNGGKHLYFGFCGKEKTRQGKKDWLI